MELRPLNQIELDNFVSSQPHSQFLQSWSWGEFQKNVGPSTSPGCCRASLGTRQVWRFGVYQNNLLIASASIIEHPLPLKKNYLYCPRGPIIKNDLPDEQKEESLKLILSKARDLTIQTKQVEEIFFRLEPPQNLPLDKLGVGLRGKLPFSNSLIKTKSIQPANTLILNLQKSTEELLADLHPKTRYNIHLAEKNGVNIKKLTAADFSNVWPLFLQTAKKDNFNLHQQKYYQTMLNALKEVELWVAKNSDNAIIAANLMSFYGDMATYLHGASDYNFRQLMAPNLLQWTLIQEAKNRGCKYYDWHGIAPDDNKKHPWAGITRFKKGFGGKIINYSGTFDFIYESGWYKTYQIIRKINRIIRTWEY